MRQISLALGSRACALACTTLILAGCGAVPALTATGPRQAPVRTQSLVEEGTITFDKTMLTQSIDILGVGPVYAAALTTAGIKTVKQLLLAGATPTARKHLAADTAISPKRVLTWINHADLMRVMGCGPEYARLLERAGVDSVLELAQRNPTKLAAQLKVSNELGGGVVAVHRVPDVVTTTKWIANAASFARIVSY